MLLDWITGLDFATRLSTYRINCGPAKAVQVHCLYIFNCNSNSFVGFDSAGPHITNHTKYQATLQIPVLCGLDIIISELNTPS